jgi:hypothetical protein
MGAGSNKRPKQTAPPSLPVAGAFRAGPARRHIEIQAINDADLKNDKAPLHELSNSP